MEEIRFENVSVAFEGKRKEITLALSEVSTRFAPGSFSVILGPSGSGKSTLLNVLTNQVDYDGEIYFGNKNLRSIKVQDRSISYCNQASTLYPSLTVYENIAFPLKSAKMPFEDYDLKVKEIASAFGILPLLTRKPKYISLGQASRVCLARALIKDSALFLFDEPFAHLDPLLKKELLPLLKERVKERKASAIYVTNFPEEAYLLSEKERSMYVLKDGRIYGTYAKAELLSSSDPFLISTRSSEGGRRL